jgi:SAM-dependent methyltransferase
MHNISDLLTEKQFYEFVLNEYEASRYESKELLDNRFKRGTYYSYVCKTRCFLVYREIAKQMVDGFKILDVGFFPGTLVRQLKMLLKDRIRCYGVGLNVDDDFENFMSPYLEKCAEVELDPFYAKSGQKISIPFESDFFDAVVATEVLEHLISPLEMISEAARMLQKGGLFILTSPNVAHIGAVTRLLRGTSNYERLDSSPMHLQNDTWRGHIRFYDKDELKKLFHRNGFRLIKHRYYRELGWQHANWRLLKRLIIWIIDKCVPIYREGHYAVFRKI